MAHESADDGGARSGRRILALVGGVRARHLDVFVHPDQQAVGVANLEVEPGFRRQRLASVLMDALYAGYPTAWINHGGRTSQGTLWWDRYDEPAPERNVHNRPPAEGAAYFEPVAVAGQRARNAYQNRYQGVHAHREHVYHRYGEALEAEARRYAPAFRDPALRDRTYGGTICTAPCGSSSRPGCTGSSTTAATTPPNAPRCYWTTSATATCRTTPPGAVASTVRSRNSPTIASSTPHRSTGTARLPWHGGPRSNAPCQPPRRGRPRLT